MKVTAIVNSRAIRLFQVSSGMESLFWPDFTASLRDKFRFVGIPLELEDYDLSKGVNYSHGTHNGTVIDQLQVFSDGVVVNSRGRGELCDEFIDVLLDLGKQKFSLEYENAEPVSRAYVSTLEVETNKDVFRNLSKFGALSQLLGELVGAYNQRQGNAQLPKFVIAGLSFSTDPSLDARPSFTFERKADTGFDQNIFFSQAPLITGDHIMVLERLDRL